MTKITKQQPSFLPEFSLKFLLHKIKSYGIHLHNEFLMLAQVFHLQYPLKMCFIQEIVTYCRRFYQINPGKLRHINYL